MSDTPSAPTPTSGQQLAAWSWIPTLYFASGLPLILVMSVATVMYKELEVSNTEIALYTSLLYLPWTVKPLWSPLVDLFGTQRRWILATQVVIALSMAGVAAAVPTASFFVATLACFWAMAIGSATHDIAADGFYMASMPPREQAWFVGIRSAFYRMATIAGSGAVVMLAGFMSEANTASFEWMPEWLATAWTGTLSSVVSWAGLPVVPSIAWSRVLWLTAAAFGLVALYHAVMLPRPESPERPAGRSVGAVLAETGEVFASFFRKRHAAMAITYMLLYRFSEAQLAKLKAPFLIDTVGEGGLGLTTVNVGFLDGTIGIALLTIGGILGGLILARDGLKPWILPMAVAINLPNALYAYLAFTQPTSQWIIGAVIAVEQLGYGLGFSAYMLFMLYFSRGEHQTAHYAICTGFMALGMMIPGMFCGALQEAIGYPRFFVWVTLSMIPSLVITWLVPVLEVEVEESP